MGHGEAEIQLNSANQRGGDTLAEGVLTRRQCASEAQVLARETCTRGVGGEPETTPWCARRDQGEMWCQ